MGTRVLVAREGAGVTRRGQGTPVRADGKQMAGPGNGRASDHVQGWASRQQGRGVPGVMV